MLSDRVESAWIDAFAQTFALCRMRSDERIAILCESQSRALNVQLAELALGQIGCSAFLVRVPTPSVTRGPVIRSSGASLALTGQDVVVRALSGCDVVIDLTLEGLMHARETATILKGGARIMTISNEHPEALARTIPTEELKERAMEGIVRCRAAHRMTVRSDAGTSLDIALEDAMTVGVWGWTDKPGTLAHWPGGLVVCFPRANAVNGRLAYRPGDMNLTFKRYFDSAVDLIVEHDYVTRIEGIGTDAALMRDYFAAFGEKEAYATSHVGWGLNPSARYEALTMYDRRDTNCTELRAVAGNFLYSTGANEFAGRFTRGHFDLPMMRCDVALDDVLVVAEGKLI